MEMYGESPVAEGEPETVPVFCRADFLPPGSPAAFRLKGVETVGGDGVRLRYQKESKG